MSMMSPTPDPRSRHYGEFYQLRPLPAGDLPLLVVVGNCQAESLRLLLGSSGAVRSFRIPPVHEWSASELPLVRRALQHADVLLSQPIRDDYRGLPVGTRQLAAVLRADAVVHRFPVLRFDGLMPYQAIIRSPQEPGLNPPVVPYHDLRILAAADRGLDHRVEVAPGPAVLRQLAAMSVSQLARREARHDAIPLSDYLATTPVWHTINHPDNATLVELARRVLARLQDGGILDRAGKLDVTAPAERELLGGLQAPVSAAATAALGVTGTVTGREHWFPGLDERQLVHQQLRFYRAHPEIITAGMNRHAERLALLELSNG